MRKYLVATVAALGVLGAMGADVGALAQTGAQIGAQTGAQTGEPDAVAPARAVRRRGPARKRMARAPAATADAMVEDGSAPPTSAYRGGASVPLSQNASNLGSQTRRSEIAPRLPDPQAGSNSPEALLRAAQRSLSQNKTGAAQQALEMAETRVLSRTTEPSMAGAPDTAVMTQRIGDARRALGAGDRAGAQAAIAAALAAPVPPPGPAVTTTTTYPGAVPMPAPRTY